MKIIKNEEGFTLVEVVIVMVIIGLLALLIIPGVNIARRNARDTARKSDLQGFKLFIEDQYSKNRNRYPDASDVTISGNTATIGEDSLTFNFAGDADLDCSDTQSERGTMPICYEPGSGNQSYTLSIILESGELVEIGED